MSIYGFRIRMLGLSFLHSTQDFVVRLHPPNLTNPFPKLQTSPSLLPRWGNNGVDFCERIEAIASASVIFLCHSHTGFCSNLGICHFGYLLLYIKAALSIVQLEQKFEIEGLPSGKGRERGE